MRTCPSFNRKQESDNAMKHLAYFSALLLVSVMLLWNSANIAEAQSIKIETAEFSYLSNQQKEELQQKLRDIGVIASQDRLEFVGRQPRQRDLDPGTKDLIGASAGPMVCREILSGLEDAVCKSKNGADKLKCLAKFKQDYAPKYRECNTIKLSSN